MKTIAVLNLKGGVAKTTTAIHLAAILATEYEQRVLLIDADSQGDATKSLLPPGDYATLTELLLGDEPELDSAACPSAVRGLDVLPSDFRLATVGMRSVRRGLYNQRAIVDLRDVAEEQDLYDVIIIDCPSAFIHPGCQAAVLAATELIIPVKADAYSAAGAAELAEQVQCLRMVNPYLRVAGCLMTMTYRDEYVCRKIADLRETSPVPVFATQIRRGAKADGGAETAEGILAYSPRSAVARDYRAWVAEYMGGGGA